MDIREIHRGFTVNKSPFGQILSIEVHYIRDIKSILQTIMNYLRTIGMMSVVKLNINGVELQISQANNISSLVDEYYLHLCREDNMKTDI